MKKVELWNLKWRAVPRKDDSEALDIVVGDSRYRILDNRLGLAEDVKTLEKVILEFDDFRNLLTV